MDVTILAFVFGGFLLSLAVVGGNFRDLTVPELGWTARRLTLLLGIVFIGVALLLDLGRSEPRPAPSASAVAERSGPPLPGTEDSANLHHRHRQQHAVAAE